MTPSPDPTARVSHFLSLPYTIVLKRDEDGDVVAAIAELSGCMTHAENESDAIRSLRDAQTAWLVASLEAGLEIPLPFTEIHDALPRHAAHAQQAEDIATLRKENKRLSDELFLASQSVQEMETREYNSQLSAAGARAESRRLRKELEKPYALELAAYLGFIRGKDIDSTVERARANLVERALRAEAERDQLRQVLKIECTCRVIEKCDRCEAIDTTNKT